MNKLLTIGFVSLGLASITAFAGTESALYQTSKHNIRITCSGDDVYSYSENCTYQSWNKPKQVGQGKPDLEIHRGEFRKFNTNATGVYCSGGMYGFDKGNLSIVIQWGLVTDNRKCFQKRPPRNAGGDLTIFINGKQKDHYWLY